MMDNPKTKMEVETPYELLKDYQKKQLGKNNEAKMTLYNALPRKEYKRVFMYKTLKEVWHTLIITHQGNSQVKDYKIDLLTQQYEKFLISIEETIDSGFTRFNVIVTSLKSLDHDYSSKNHGLIGSEEAAVIALETKAVKAKDKGEVGTIAAKMVTSLNDATYLMAVNSLEVQPKPSTSNNNIDLFELQKENEELLRFNKDFTKTSEKLLKEKRSLESEKLKLLNKINDLKLEIDKLEKDKEVVEPCKKCDVLTKEVDSLRCNVSKLQDEALNFSKFKKSSFILDDMLNNATYSASADDIVVQSCFFDIQLTNLSPRNCIPPEVLSTHPA
ncbi:hypothetical protein Tco_0311729 [Tanacetum coccineum]